MIDLQKAIIYSGIVTFICLMITATLGITGVDFSLHKKMGITTFTFACVHVGIVLYKQFKVRKARKQAGR